MLPVRVMFRGKSAQGLQLEMATFADGQFMTTIPGRTNDQGRIEIRLQRGLCRLHTLHMERCGEPAVADWESFWASLTFEVK